MKRPDSHRPAASEDWGCTYEQTRLRQLRQGLDLSPAERLEWLERALEEWAPLVGTARRASAGD